MKLQSYVFGGLGCCKAEDFHNKSENWLLVFSNSQQDYVNWRKEGVVVKGQIPRKLQESLGILHDWGCWITMAGVHGLWYIIEWRRQWEPDYAFVFFVNTTEVDYPTIANDWSAFPYFHYEVFLFE